MRRFIISGAFFHQNRNTFLAQFPAAFSEVTAHTTILDQKTLCSALRSMPVQKLSTGDNIFIIFEHDTQKNVQFTLDRVKSFAREQGINIIFDCTLLSLESALESVQKIQYNLPILNVKVNALAVVCNDIEIFDFSTAFSNALRVAPLNYSTKQLSEIYRRSIRLAVYYRYFAWSSIARIFHRIYWKIRSFKK